MRRLAIVMMVLLLFISSSAQKTTFYSAAATNTNSALPFGKLVGLVAGVYHPGLEISYGVNWRSKKRFFQVLVCQLHKWPFSLLFNNY